MNHDVKKSLDELRQIWRPEKSCITCQQYESNYMTPQGFGQCAHLPKWQSTSPHSHCTKHTTADNATERLEWLAKRGKK